MLILRLVLILVVLLLVLSGGMYMLTRNPRYLKLARQVLRLTVFMLLVLALLFVLERYVLTGWRILL